MVIVYSTSSSNTPVVDSHGFESPREASNSRAQALRLIKKSTMASYLASQVSRLPGLAVKTFPHFGHRNLLAADMLCFRPTFFAIPFECWFEFLNHFFHDHPPYFIFKVLFQNRNHFIILEKEAGSFVLKYYLNPAKLTILAAL
jgi:hypothetical protein